MIHRKVVWKRFINVEFRSIFAVVKVNPQIPDYHTIHANIMPEFSMEKKKYPIGYPAILIFWFLVYSIGKHPDFPWGDGIGYAMAIEHGFDLSTNANSHFLYLNFHRLMMVVFHFQDPAFLLGWASIGWAILCLFLTFKISSIWSGNKAALVSSTLLASSFPFWRHACIVEVYTMELSFWACLFLLLYYWTEKQSLLARNGLFFACAISLLVHIHFILFIPLLFAVCIYRKEWPNWPWIFGIIPVLIVTVSVYYLKTNTLSQVFFENVQDKMLSFDWRGKLIGPFFTVFLLLAMFPLGIGTLVFGWLKNRSSFTEGIFSKILIATMIPLSGFVSLFPEPGIYVFLLPVILVASLMSGRIIALYLKPLHAFACILIFQMLFFYSEKQLFDSFAGNDRIVRQEIKGGTGFLFLPWAKGNVASVLDKMKMIPIESFPENDRWNAQQALNWNKTHPDYNLMKR
jgi:Protein of unknown function (DUF2723)